MDSHKTRGPWGKLVKLDSSDEVLLFNRESTVGRKRGCDLSFPSNKFVSGVHCKIAHDESSGLVWLEDTSTNGTVINMSKLIKKQTHELQNGDVIHLVYRKNEPHERFHLSNINYIYSANLIYFLYLFFADISSPFLSSDMSLSVSPVLLTKPPQGLTQEDPLPSTSTDNYCIKPALTVQASTSHAQCFNKATINCNITVLTNIGSDPGVPHSSNTDGSGPSAGSNASVVSEPPAEANKTDKMEESLTCIICQDLLYDCVSVQPCMHTFCAACYSGWMERSPQCPTCRCPVERIRKNHILNNLVEAYLLQHPEKCRSEEDRKSMDSRNKITQDMRQPIIERSFSEEEASSDYLYDFSDNDSDSSDNSQTAVMCRQCPGYKSDIRHVLLASGSGSWLPVLSSSDQPSTSTDAASAPQEYRCPPFASHLFCACCFQPMPDRRPESNTSNSKFSQQCTICQRYFCHMYWVCPRIDCHGCLAQFSDLNLTEKCLDGVLNNNNYESEILQNYLSVQGKTWKDVLQETLQADERRSNLVYHFCSDSRITANTVLCYSCGLRTFKELAYKYRVNIPAYDLPSGVTSRPDCYWGRNCRTQVKAHHARNFNHICEQTRFKS
uniref:E3 ubiquitin-protein ligase CHFR n=1 Tax=Neogobius melanostomus TaxID=47308 RepID=A0A8C6UKV8_9GOBI